MQSPKKIAVIAGWVVGALAALVILALVAVLVFVDPNDYREDIERTVERQTGRQLTLGGELKLSVFPWLALQTGPASLSDAPGFGEEPFVALQNARISVRLLPLLRGDVQVGTISLQGARIRLITDAQGRNNWADLGSQQATSEEAPDQPPASFRLPTIAGLEIEDAALTQEDRRAGSRRVIRDFNLKTGRLESGEPFDLTTDLVLEQDASLSVKVHMTTAVTVDLKRNVHLLAEPGIDLTLSGPGYPQQGVEVRIRANSLRADIGQQAHQLEGLVLATTWKGDGLPPEGVAVTVQMESLAADLAAQTLKLAGLQADVAGARLSGALNGEEILDAPRMAGSLKLAPVTLRDWLPKLGVNLPATRDASVYGEMSFASNIALTKSSAELKDMTLKFDDTTAKGSLGVADFESKALRFDLGVDRINADRYLAPAGDSDDKRQAPPEKTEDAPPAKIPVEALRALNARGQLQVGEAVFAGVTFSRLHLGVSARGGKVRFNPSQASMYGGQYSGDIAIDATTDIARVSLDEHLSGVDFAPLFKDLFETQRVAGKGSANLKLSGAGRTSDDIVKTLNGTLDFAVADGAVSGADLWYEIRRARAVLKQQAVPERTGPARTEFKALRGSAIVKDGVLSNDDLDASLQYLKVTGQGKVDLPQDTLDYRLTATVLKIPPEGADTEQMQELADATIPVKISGTLSDPKVRPDIEGYLKNKFKGRIDEQRDKAEEKLKEQEEKLKEKVGDKLKGLFGR